MLKLPVIIKTLFRSTSVFLDTLRHFIGHLSKCWEENTEYYDWKRKQD